MTYENIILDNQFQSESLLLIKLDQLCANSTDLKPFSNM